MKIKSFLLTALAASMTFVACDNNDNEMGQSDNTPKSVSINLPNVFAGTRSAGTPIEAQSKVALTDLQVFFTDGTNLHKGKTTEGTDATHYFSTKTDYDNRGDKVFHFLPHEVNKVIVVGNNGEEISATTYAELKKELGIEHQQDPKNLDLYKEADLTSVSGSDEFGHPLYKVDVELEPRVSRIEIGSFKYKAPSDGGERFYKSIEVLQVMINNYFEKADLQMGTASTIKNEGISDGEIFALFEKANGWYSDKFKQTETPATQLPLVTLNETAQFEHAYAQENVRPAYHFFPKDNQISTTNHPQVLVKMIGVKTDDTKVPLYLVANKFNPAVDQNMAMIYVMDFEFDDNDLKNPQKCVEVTVDVKSWQIVQVKPDFN